ncbi:MAG: hypothetical protein DVB28_001652 [Verrucomicrobia bacterium]|nr:MAG: hypothetical protein DVB28_001652 [Verrucomicrobiota bacterium]
MLWSFKFADGKSQILAGVLRADEWNKPADKITKKAPPADILPDAAIEYKGAGLSFRDHSRPRMSRYTEAQREDLAKKWDTFPAASQRWIRVEVRADKAGGELWLEGRYCGRVQSESALVEVTLKLEAGGSVRGAKVVKRPEQGRFLTLEVKHIARPGVMQEAEVSLRPGLQQLHGVPIFVAEGGQNADVGFAREMQGLRALETNENTSRTSLDGMPESLHFSVPQAWYHRAWVLCALDSDPKLDPILTTRLTRFGVAGRGEAMADTTLTLPRAVETAGPGFQKVGTVEYLGDGGRKLSTALYLVKVELKTGSILDLLSDNQDPAAPMKIGPYLDFEFLGKCGSLDVQTDRRRKPLPTSKSGVHVFGVTLEKAPVEMRLKQTQYGNIFHNAESPETTVSLRANAPGKYTLHREITGVDGAVVARAQSSVELATLGAEADVRIPLSQPGLGWFGLRLTVTDEGGQTFFSHQAAFALLGEDTRKAGYESPFGTWWFGGAHYTTRELSVVGPLLLKAGMRRTPVNWTQDSEADLAPWKVSLNQISWPFRRADLEDWPAAEARAEKAIREKLVRFPHCQYIDLFHESFDNVLPPELYGGKYEPTDAAREDQLFDLGVKGARFIRAKFPELKIIAGNHGGSASTIAMLLRRGFPRELIDYLGTEAVGQTISPEKLSIHTTAGIWLLKETARKFGHEIPLSGCFEYTSRAERDLGAQRLAEWYTRDILFGLAHRFPTISPGGIEDVGSCYFDTLYGAAGFCERRPLHYPKPAYVAVATLTKALDSVKLVRQMPTDSSSAHALEFERAGEYVYAVWTPRGHCELEFEFPSETALVSTAFYGARKTLQTSGNRLSMDVSSAVTYLTASKAALSARAGKRSFPDNLPPAGTTVVSRMDDPAQWSLGGPEPKLETTERRAGRFALAGVTDPEKGACLELEPRPEGNLPDIVGEYASLRLNVPAPIPGTPDTVGVWVKGNSSWGRIFWEVQDAKGERWISAGGYDGGDWGNQSSLDFDGWCYVSFPLTNSSPASHLEPGFGAGQWKGNGDGRLDYPLKLSGLFVETHRRSLNLTEMEPVKGRLRIKDASASAR